MWPVKRSDIKAVSVFQRQRSPPEGGLFELCTTKFRLYMPVNDSVGFSACKLEGHASMSKSEMTPDSAVAVVQGIVHFECLWQRQAQDTIADGVVWIIHHGVEDDNEQKEGWKDHGGELREKTFAKT